MTSSQGVVFIHSTPSVLCPHIEWALGAAFGVPVDLSWHQQPVERSTYRTELTYTAPSGTAAALASALQRIDKVRFEVTQDPCAGREGVRYSFTPTLGLFSAVTASNGDIVVPEGRIKKAVVVAALGGADLATAMNDLLGVRWDDELEPFRHAGADSPVRWLHQVG